MTRHNHQLTRRTATKTIAAALGITGTGLTALALTSTPADASVDSSFDVPDASLEDEDGAPSAIFLFASGNWEYDVNVAVGEYALALYTLDVNDQFYVVDVTERLTTNQIDNGGFDLGGDLLATGGWTDADFTAPGPGKSITRNVTVGVLLRVLDPDGTLITDGRATTTVGITVTESELSASIGGTGDVVFKEDDGDATPTPP